MNEPESWRQKLADHSIEEILREGPGYVFHRARRRAIAAWYRRYLAVRTDHRALDASRAVAELSRADEAVFLCLGNICRSPFAERYARRRLQERGGDDLAVDSAGVGEISGRSSPRRAVEAARKRDVDLTGHTSDTDPRGVDDAVVFVMDYNNYHDARRLYPCAADRTFFLSAFSSEDEIAIEDPHGTDAETFDRVYAEIAECVDTLVDAYVEATGGAER